MRRRLDLHREIATVCVSLLGPPLVDSPTQLKQQHVYLHLARVELVNKRRYLSQCRAFT